MTYSTICESGVEECFSFVSRDFGHGQRRFQLRVVPFEQNSRPSCCFSLLLNENEQCLHDLTTVGLSQCDEMVSLLEALDDLEKGGGSGRNAVRYR